MGWRVLLAIAAMAVAVVGVGAGLAPPPQLGELISASEAATLRGGKCYKDTPGKCDVKKGKCTIDDKTPDCDVYNDLHYICGDGNDQGDGKKYCCGTMPGEIYNCGVYDEKAKKCATTAVVVVVGVQ
jgi:hypothetical protein